MSSQDMANELLALFSQLKPINRIKRFHPDVPHSEFLMLWAIKECTEKKRGICPDSQGVTPSELAARLGSTPSAVSKLLKGPEDQGFVYRIYDTKDRRCAFLSLTEKGEQILKEAGRYLRELTVRIVERMGEEEIRNLLVLLKKFHRIMKEECKEDFSCSK